jgi:hypothetical protein
MPMPKSVDTKEAMRAQAAAWERFTVAMARIRKAVIEVMTGIDERRRIKESEEARKRISNL